MTGVAAAIVTYFERNDWPVDHIDDDDLVGLSITSINGEHGTWPLVVGVIGDPGYLVVQSIVPPVAPQGDEVSVLELLTRINDGLVAGCFELNFDDGSIRLRSSAPVDSLAAVAHETLVEFVADVVAANVITADRYIPAIDAVIDHHVAPGIAVAAVEAGIDPAVYAEHPDHD